MALNRYELRYGDQTLFLFLLTIVLAAVSFLLGT